MVFVIISILWETFSRLYEKSMAFVHENGCKMGSQPKGYSFIISAKYNSTNYSSWYHFRFSILCLSLLPFAIFERKWIVCSRSPFLSYNVNVQVHCCLSCRCLDTFVWFVFFDFKMNYSTSSVSKRFMRRAIYRRNKQKKTQPISICLII